MKRTQPDPADIERAREAARQQRIDNGLPEVAPGDGDYEAGRDEAKARAQRAADAKRAERKKTRNR